MTDREKKGILLAAMARIVRKDAVWVVPSQTKATKKYRVNVEKGTCTCADQAEWGNKCKHLYAAEIVCRRDGNATFPDEDVDLDVKKPTYKQNWPAYNLAQTEEKHRFQELLFDLCLPLAAQTPTRKSGRPRVPMADAVFASVFKVYSTVSSRRFMSDLKDAQEKGYVRKSIHFNGITRYLDWEPMTDVLMKLIEKSSLPLRAIETDFAVDSTGFSTSRFVRWFDEKYGMTRSRHDWVKVHVMAGVKTNIVTAVEIRHRSAHDSPIFGVLLARTERNFSISEVSADKGYSSVKNLHRAVKAGAIPYIAFKENASLQRGGIWEKMLLYYQLNREDFLAHYHKRSNVESTFAMIKAKFRDHVRSRTDRTMKNEALAKILCHNICCVIQSQCELGIEPEFWKNTLAAEPLPDAG